MERRRGEPYSAAERRRRLEPVAERIHYHQARNAAARVSHAKTRAERLRSRGHPPGALADCRQEPVAL